MQIRSAIDQFLTRYPGPGVVAVSGGADSVALLRALDRVDHLHVAHFDHQLRGADSDADAEFVRDLAKSLTRPFHLGTAPVAELSRGTNLEATARRLRYGWLGEVARVTGSAWVVTAHTADDQAETLLHRIVRGTGVAGLRGIAACRPLTDGVILVRPLLEVARADLRSYLVEVGQPFREDASNADPRYTRNRIRRDLLPLLSSFNPTVVEALTRLALQAGEVSDWLQGEATKLLVSAERPRAGAMVVLAVEPLLVAPSLLVREALRIIWTREGWPAGRMTREHWARAEEIIRGTLPAADFPDGVQGDRRDQVVRWSGPRRHFPSVGHADS